MKTGYLTLHFALLALLLGHCAPAPVKPKTPARHEALFVDVSMDSDAKLLAEGSSLRFPTYAQSAGKSGYVEVSIEVDSTGHVSEVKILKEVPVGYGFAEAASDHAYQLLFIPAVAKGKCVSQKFHRKYEFNLNSFQFTRPQD